MGAELSPEYWHARAEKTRATAENLGQFEAKEALYAAENYERLAKFAENLRKMSGDPITLAR